MKNENIQPYGFRQALASRDEPEAQQYLATVYWSALLILLGCSFLGGIAYGVWQFQQSIMDEVDAGVRPQQNLSKTDLQNVLRLLEARVVNFEARRAAPVTLPDPS